MGPPRPRRRPRRNGALPERGGGDCAKAGMEAPLGVDGTSRRRPPVEQEAFFVPRIVKPKRPVAAKEEAEEAKEGAAPESVVRTQPPPPSTEGHEGAKAGAEERENTSTTGEEKRGKQGFFARLPELRRRAQALASQGVDVDTIATLLQEPVDRVKNYCGQAIEFGKAQLKAQIMRSQVKAAIEDRDVVMLKRLGEEFCGQGIVTQQGAIANAGKQVFVLNVGVPPKNLDGPPPAPVRALPSRKVETLDADFEDVTLEG